MEFIRETTLVHLKIRQWSGEIKAQRTDITLGDGGELPPKELLDLGRKKIFPPEALRPFNNLRAAAERACLELGTRFMGGLAIPDSQLETLQNELNDIQEAFAVALGTFEVSFENKKQDWMQQNQKHAHMFNTLPSVEDVRNRFSFSFGCYKLNPIEGFEPDMEEVADQVLHEICLYCNNLADRLIKRKTNTSGNSLCKLIAPVINKLETLSFGNGRILSVLSEFKKLNNAIPDARISKDDAVFKNTVTFLSMCGDEGRLETILNGGFSVASLFVPAEPEPQTIGDLLQEQLPEKERTILQSPQQQSQHAETLGAFF